LIGRFVRVLFNTAYKIYDENQGSQKEDEGVKISKSNR